jgi:hypothetical protein
MTEYEKALRVDVARTIFVMFMSDKELRGSVINNLSTDEKKEATEVVCAVLAKASVIAADAFIMANRS